jgi:hypothetical protein
MAAYDSLNLRYAVIEAETVTGTMETPAAADYDIRLFNVEHTPTVDQDDEAAKDATGDHGESESIPGKSYGTINLMAKLNWGGAVGTDPLWWKLAASCGAKKKAYAAAGVAITPDQEYDVKTCTIWVFEKERGGAAPVSTIFKYAGCMGNMIIGAEATGAPWQGNFAMQGKLVDVVDGAALAMTAVQTALAEKFLSSTYTWNSLPAKISTFSLDVGNEIVPVYDQGDATGISHYSIASRRPRFMCNPLAEKQATDDVHDDLVSANAGDISLTSTNFTLTAADAQLLSSAAANREGYTSWDRVYKCLRNFDGSAVIDASLTAEQTWELLQGARS